MTSAAAAPRIGWHVPERTWRGVERWKISTRFSTPIAPPWTCHPARHLLGEPYSVWDADHFAKSLLAGLEGDIRVHDDTIVVTYHNAPNVAVLREHYEDLPGRLEKEHVDPHIPWLYGFKLDFRFR